MCDGYNSLWSESEFWVQNKDWHDNDKSNKCGSKDVDHHGFFKMFIFVAIFKFIQSRQIGLVWVKIRIRQEGNPFGITHTECEKGLFSKARASSGNSHHKGRDTKG